MKHEQRRIKMKRVAIISQDEKSKEEKDVYINLLKNQMEYFTKYDAETLIYSVRRIECRQSSTKS